MSKVNIYISIISNPSHTEQVPERNVDGRDGVDPHPLAAVWWIGDGFGGWGMGDGGVMRGTRQRIWHFFLFFLRHGDAVKRARQW